jgi:dTDP-4-dehydrorhamnose reductase
MRDKYSVTLGLHARDVSLAGATSRRINMGTYDSFSRDVDEIQPEVIIHTAALTSVEECERDPKLARYVNVNLAENVARVCASFDLALVHISTDHLFSGKSSCADETCLPAPRNVYAITKAEAEHRVLARHPKALVVRTNLYGWGPTYRHSFSDLILNSLRANRELSLFNDVFYTPILIEFLVTAAHELNERGGQGIYHIVSDDRVSKYEFGCLVAERFGLDSGLINPISIASRPELVYRPREMSLSNLKTRQLLGRRLGEVSAHLDRLYQQKHFSSISELRRI